VYAHNTIFRRRFAHASGHGGHRGPPYGRVSIFIVIAVGVVVLAPSSSALSLRNHAGY